MAWHLNLASDTILDSSVCLSTLVIYLLMYLGSDSHEVKFNNCCCNCWLEFLSLVNDIFEDISNRNFNDSVHTTHHAIQFKFMRRQFLKYMTKWRSSSFFFSVMKEQFHYKYRPKSPAYFTDSWLPYRWFIPKILWLGFSSFFDNYLHKIKKNLVNGTLQMNHLQGSYYLLTNP